MAENKPGPMRTVEEPPGFDTPPTDRIPVQGDLSDRRPDAEPPDRPAEESVEPDADLAEPPAEPPLEPPTEPTIQSPAVTSIFDDTATGRFQDRWRELQAGFVDNPADAVRAADELVDEIMRELAERRRNIEEQWRGGPDDTEDLRMVIQEYRAFFNQLLNS